MKSTRPIPLITTAQLRTRAYKSGAGCASLSRQKQVAPLRSVKNTELRRGRQAEQVLQAWYEEGRDKSVSTVRPTVIFGEENRGNVYNLLKQIVSGKFLMVGKGENEKSMAPLRPQNPGTSRGMHYVKNITAFLQYLAENPGGYQVYNYVDKPDLSTRELIRNTEDSLDVSVPPVRIPYWLGLLSVGLLRRSSRGYVGCTLCEGDACWAATALICYRR